MRANALCLGVLAASLLLAACSGGGSAQAPKPCDGVTCGGHGRCLTDDETPICVCDTGYQANGLDCAAVLDPCAGVTCSGHGTCSVEAAVATCRCDSGYHAQGTSCLSNQAPCDGQTCSGHGTCSASGASASCACEQGYHPDPGDALSCLADAACVDGDADSYGVGCAAGPDCDDADPAVPGTTACPSGALLTWNPPTTNADGTALVDLAGFRIHYDTSGRGGDAGYRYAQTLDIGMANCATTTGGVECQYNLDGLNAASGTTWYFTVSAYDSANPRNESVYSNESSKTF